MDKRLAAYLEAALWASTDLEGDPLDSRYSIYDFDPDSLKSALKDVEDFFFRNADLIEKSGADDAQTAHDFWLTRNRHGAGFWDRGYPDGIGNALTRAAHSYGSCDVFEHEGETGVYLQ